MRKSFQFTYDVIAGTAAHLILMLAGVIVAMICFRKPNEGVLLLIMFVIVPFTCAGMFIAHRGVHFARTVSLVSGAVALLVPPIVIAAYWDWNWTQIGPDYLGTIVGLPFSVVGAHYIKQTAVADAHQPDK
ncbi:hypothetical protein Mal52_11070 [Symmachiella dynata]|uniref:Uncharacterized protein n=1 Tax=Symmachiella dynata TaxID=2527995 RepID=A0A517ZJI3_9PLAN|nr:hypothetical protein [Symmachiella dynata]QDU42640.1 hypothetical protein Mal52_11070 [Symmachiella dynata]